MRRSVAIFLLAGFFSFVASARAEGEKTATPAKMSAEEKRIAEIRKNRQEKKNELNGSKWQVTLSSSDPKINGKKDTMTFQNYQIHSDFLASKGFPSSNYTVSIPEGTDTGVWETMKTSADGIAFMHGEWAADKMQGVISEQLPKGKTLDYSFSSTGKVEVPKTVEVEKDKSVNKAGADQTALVSESSSASKESETSSSKSKKAKIKGKLVSL